MKERNLLGLNLSRLALQPFHQKSIVDWRLEGCGCIWIVASLIHDGFDRDIE